MLAIRLQRVGRKGYALYRVAVMEAQRHPSTGRVVAYVGTFNPHTKEHKLNKELIEKYLNNGAQPTPRVVKLLVEDKIKLPNWVVKHPGDKKGKIRFEDKLRKNQPEDAKKESSSESPVDSEATEKAEEVTTEETPVTEEAPAEETPAEPSEIADASHGLKEKPAETVPEEAPAEAEATPEEKPAKK